MNEPWNVRGVSEVELAGVQGGDALSTVIKWVSPSNPSSTGQVVASALAVTVLSLPIAAVAAWTHLVHTFGGK
jgi:hypothetical protein